MTVRKSLSQIRQDLQRKINEAGEFYTERIPAELGNHEGVVPVPDTENMVYVRVSNGLVLQVFNNVAPNIYNWKVYIGRDKSQPSLFKVIEVRWVYNITQTVAYVLFHHSQHEYPAPDTTWIHRDQFLPLLILPKGGFEVRLYGDMVYRSGMATPIRVADQDIDLSSHAISVGAKYVLLEVASDGSLNYVTGDTYANREVLYTTAYPTPSAGAFPIAVFIFHEGQTELRRDTDERTIIDLRMFTSDVVTPASQQVIFLDDLADVDVPSPTDGQVLTWNSYAQVWDAEDPPAGVGAVDSVNGDTGVVVVDYASVSGQDPGTDVTAAELEELTDGSETVLHSHELFNDGEGDPAAIGTAADGTSIYAARRDHVHGMVTGSAALGSAFTLNASNGTYQDTGLSVTLPSAGTYNIDCVIRGVFNDSGAGGYISAKLYNSTDSADVANTGTLVLYYNTGVGTTAQATVPLMTSITVAASKTIKLYAQRTVTGTPGATLIDSNSNGYTTMRYTKTG